MLSLVVTLSAWYLTRLVTHIDRVAAPIIAIEFDEHRPFEIERVRFDLGVFLQDRARVPRIMVAGYDELLFIVTPATRSIAIEAKDRSRVSCSFSERVSAAESLGALFEEVKGSGLRPIEIASGPRVLVAVPPALHAALERLQHGQGVIACTFAQRLTVSPTFTERKIGFQVKNGLRGAAVLDFSTLDDIDNLRFSGGLIAPLAGDRARVFDSQDRVVIAEWADVSAEERRDVVLVTIGALAAVAAATAIEAIRPFIER